MLPYVVSSFLVSYRQLADEDPLQQLTRRSYRRHDLHGIPQFKLTQRPLNLAHPHAADRVLAVQE